MSRPSCYDGGVNRLPRGQQLSLICAVLDRPDVSALGKAVYARLVVSADAQAVATTYRSTLASVMSTSERSISRTLSELHALGIVSSWKARGGWNHRVRPVTWDDVRPASTSNSPT